MARLRWFLFPEGDGGDHFPRKAQLDQLLAAALSPFVAQRTVIFFCPAFVAMTFNTKGFALKAALHAAGHFFEFADLAWLDVRLIVIEVNRLPFELVTVFVPTA